MSTYKLQRQTRACKEHGVVLIVALMLLMVLSILASVSIRGATSSEQIANQDRQKALAHQTAEAALRFCEQQVQLNAAGAATNAAGVATFTPEAPPVGAGATFNWQTMANWDDLPAPAGAPRVVAFTSQGDAAAAGVVAAIAYFRRPPECMVQYTTVANTKVFVTTARGFGPEVVAKDGNTPVGTEIWLQSLITMQ